MSRYTVENLLREPTELYSASLFLSAACLIFKMPPFFLLTKESAYSVVLGLGLYGFHRLYQGFRVKRYHWNLLAMPYYALSTRDIPLSDKYLFLGRGFRWYPKHTQRLHQLAQVKAEQYTKPGRWHEHARNYVKKKPTSPLSTALDIPSRFNPFRPLPDVGGEPSLHGVGDEDKPITLPQSARVGHILVLGTTRVGKTRFSSILINQDIRNGAAVIVVDPKGDLELVKDMYSACMAANRLDDFKVVHLGYPGVSAYYNPLKNFDQITEVATRITSAIDAEGEGKQFAKFAWKYVDIVAKCLRDINRPITYNNIGFFINRMDLLLMLYADINMPKQDPGYVSGVNTIIIDNDAKVDKYGNPYPPMDRAKAVSKYLKDYIREQVEQGDIIAIQNQIIIDLYDAAIMDKDYFSKITASVGPVFAEINGSSASGIFSLSDAGREIELMDVIKNKKVVYIGLDSLTNANVAEAVGKAFLSDLVSTAGKIYKESDANYRLNLHCDELSEIIQESFVKILNKAGGAGFQVTAYAQTIQDLEVALGSKAWAKTTEGNLNTVIVLRVKNAETAQVLTDLLPKVDIVSHTQVSMVNDTPHGEDHVYFNTTNEDRVQLTSVPMLEPSDIIKLPKGQAFVLANGGELYKIRIPLPANDGLAPHDVQQVMREVNGIQEDIA